MKVSIFDLVVGDIVQLNIGDQVSIFEVYRSSEFDSILSQNLAIFLAALLSDATLIFCIAGHVQLKRALAEGCKDYISAKQSKVCSYH